MSALADCLRALVTVAEASILPQDVYDAALNVLRKHAPCGRCAGTGGYTAAFPPRCGACLDEGWTPASVEAAIKREEEQARLDAAVIEAAEAWDNASDWEWAKEAEALSNSVRAYKEGTEQ